MTGAHAAAHRAAPREARWRLYLRLGRVSNLPTVWTDVLAGAALAGGRPAPARDLTLLAALSLFYVGGMFLNDAFDRASDARERPERPIPSGLVTAAEVFAAGAAALALGAALVATVAGAASPALASALALAATIVLYDAWHKTNPLGPLVMGLCRVLVYTTAALAVTARLPAAVVGGALVLLAYLIGLTYVAKQESLARIGSLWPLAFLALPFVAGFPALRAGTAGVLVYLALVTLVGYALRSLAGTRPDRIGRAVTALIAGISLVDAVLLASAGLPRAALVAALGCPLTLVLQRYVRGT